jgi:uncharacterized protein YjlB
MREGAQEPGEYRFEDDGSIPNNPALPMLVYQQVLDGPDLDSSRCKELLSGNGWGGAWVDGVFPFHHYHSNAHEVLCVIGGSASIAFGGPEGETVEVSAGDVVVIPAGVGHCNRGSESGFSVVGAYPRGQENYDLRTGEEGERPGVQALGWLAAGDPNRTADRWWRGTPPQPVQVGTGGRATRTNRSIAGVCRG